jgi:ERCC4-type nuclease
MADKLLKECGSIEEMCFPESLKLVKGLGEKNRAKVMEVLTSENPVHIERSKFKIV